MVLIIDDGPVDIERTRIALEELALGIRVDSATDGKSALAMLRNGIDSPSLLLLDIKMAGMDGFELLREIRLDDRFRGLPVVVLTNSSLTSDRAEAIAAGASDFIQKPPSAHQFSKELESVVNRWLPQSNT